MKSGRGLESLPKKTVWVIFSKFWAVSGLILSKCSILLSTYIWTYCRSGLQIEKLRLEPSFTPRNDRNRISNDRSGFPYNQESFIFHWFAADSADIRSLHLARVPLFSHRTHRKFFTWKSEMATFPRPLPFSFCFPLPFTSLPFRWSS